MTAIEPTAASAATTLLRPVRWPEEAPLLNDLNNAGRIASGELEVLTVDGLINTYSNLVNCDLTDDLRVAEVAGVPVGYARTEWKIENSGERVHFLGLFTTPAAPAGALETMLDWGEARHATVAAALPALPSVINVFQNFETPAGTAHLEARGYRAARFFFGMVRPDLEGIPDLPLPDGVEVRPAEPAHLRAIFAAEFAAFRNHWGASAANEGEEQFRMFRDDPANDLALWQIAWAGDTIVGIIRPYINDEDFRLLGVRRGWCENISTHADWRGRGIARALIARSLAALRDRGMTEAALGVDAENATGALRVYHAMGFVERTRTTEWRRPLEPGAAS